MLRVKAKRLSPEEFKPYGQYADLLRPVGPFIGEEPVEFYRDMLQVRLGSSDGVSASVCRVKRREPLVEYAEYHNRTSEGILPLDGDVLIHVLPATPVGEFNIQDLEAFIVPAGTLVTLDPGVWHYAPYPLEDDLVNVLIMLPERTYAVDCQVKELAEEEKTLIEF